VSCYPDIAVHVRTAADDILLLACDGVWDVMSDVEAVAYLQDGVASFEAFLERGDDEVRVQCAVVVSALVGDKLLFLQGKDDDDDEDDDEDDEDGKKRGEASPLDLATALVEAALAAGSTDNITVVVCKLRGMPQAGAAAAAAAAAGDKKPKSAHANGHDGKKHTTGDAAKAIKGGGNGHGHGHGNGGNKQEKRAKSSPAGEHKRPTEKRAGNRIDFV
jgi:hypothetical protein